MLFDILLEPLNGGRMLEQPPKFDDPLARFRARVLASYVSDFKGTPVDPESTCRRHADTLDSLLGPLWSACSPLHVLELGCGPGAFLHWARARGVSSLHGIDLAEEQVALARSLDLPAEVADAHAWLQTHVGEYDLIVAFDLLEHFRRHEALDLLDLVRGALRPGGRFFLTTPNGSGWRPGPVVHGDLTHETVFTPRSLRHLLTLADFDRVHVREVRPPVHGVASFIRHGLWRVVRLLPQMLNRIETGSAGEGVFSRVMAAEARRPLEAC
jgi:2-polyprenyl-3-methyl-5-hydroxy-6-metoxy-1,4-benzoquinol methylase